MRRIALAFAIAALASGCSTPGRTQIQPAPPPVRDHKTPVAMPRPSLIQRIEAQRVEDAKTARNEIAVEGGVVR